MNKWAFLLILFHFSCGTSTDIGRKNIGFIYQPEALQLNTRFRVFHHSSDSSTLWIRIRKEDLLSKIIDGNPEAHVKIRLVVQAENEAPADTVISELLIRRENIAETAIPFFCPTGKEYVLDCQLFDLYRGRATRFLKYTDKASAFTAGSVLPTHKGAILFGDQAHPGDTLLLKGLSGSDITINYYNRSYFPALPPFSDQKTEPFDTRPDSVFNLSADHRLVLPHKGIYQLVRNGNPGFAAFVFSEDYPKITAPEQLILALRYLTTQEEFDQMKNAPDKKDFLDNFWLQAAGKDKERGRMLIKRYYSRVQEANILFTSYKEGWKTDRGMIYLLFGPPVSVYREDRTEKWVYSLEGINQSLTFQFSRTHHIFTADDFVLERSPAYRIPWYESVENWREGRIIE